MTKQEKNLVSKNACEMSILLNKMIETELHTELLIKVKEKLGNVRSQYIIEENNIDELQLLVKKIQNMLNDLVDAEFKLVDSLLKEI